MRSHLRDCRSSRPGNLVGTQMSVQLLRLACPQDMHGLFAPSGVRHQFGRGITREHAAELGIKSEREE